MLQVLHDPRQVGTDRGGPLVRAGSEAGAVAPTCMRRRMCTAVAGRAEPAGAAATACGDNSSNSARTGAATACGQAGRSYMHGRGATRSKWETEA
jgi:hypothetical protein